MDPLTMAAITALSSGLQVGLGVTSNDPYQKYNRDRLKEVQDKLNTGQVLTPEEEEAIRNAYQTPASQAASEGAKRAEQIQHAALADRGGSSGATLSAIEGAKQRAVSQAQIGAQQSILAQRVQAKRDLENELEGREAQKTAYRSDDYGVIAQQIPAVAGSVGLLAGVPPGYWQDAKLFGMPVRKQVIPTEAEQLYDAINKGIASEGATELPAGYVPPAAAPGGKSPASPTPNYAPPPTVTGPNPTVTPERIAALIGQPQPKLPKGVPPKDVGSMVVSMTPDQQRYMDEVFDNLSVHPELIAPLFQKYPELMTLFQQWYKAGMPQGSAEPLTPPQLGAP